MRACAPVLLATLLLPGCGPSDPRTAVLDERARWNADLQSWAQTEAGSINMTVRVSGPVHSVLSHLTVRVELLDATNQLIGEIWEPLDIGEVERGGPEDLSVRVADPGEGVEGVRVTVPFPTPEQESLIRELQ